MKKERIGKFILERLFVQHSPEAVRRLMGQMVVVRCEMLYHIDGFEYIAISDLFDEVEQGESVPEYTLEYLRSEDKWEDKFSFKRISSKAKPQNARLLDLA